MGRGKGWGCVTAHPLLDVLLDEVHMPSQSPSTRRYRIHGVQNGSLANGTDGRGYSENHQVHACGRVQGEYAWWTPVPVVQETKSLPDFHWDGRWGPVSIRRSWHIRGSSSRSRPSLPAFSESTSHSKPWYEEKRRHQWQRLVDTTIPPHLPTRCGPSPPLPPISCTKTFIVTQQ